MWSLKNKIYNQSKLKQTHRHRQRGLVVASGEGGGGMGKKGKGVEKYKLIVTKESWGIKVQHKEYSQQYCDNCVWCQVGTGNTGWGAHCVKYVIV